MYGDAMLWRSRVLTTRTESPSESVSSKTGYLGRALQRERGMRSPPSPHIANKRQPEGSQASSRRSWKVSNYASRLPVLA